jgi:hypothetical protein
MVGGLTVAEIARAFLVQETAMGQRITRAKAKIKAARIPYRAPSTEDLPARVSGVLAVLFRVFNEGYLATGPDTDPLRHDTDSKYQLRRHALILPEVVTEKPLVPTSQSHDASSSRCVDDFLHDVPPIAIARINRLTSELPLRELLCPNRARIDPSHDSTIRSSFTRAGTR